MGSEERHRGVGRSLVVEVRRRVVAVVRCTGSRVVVVMVGRSRSPVVVDSLDLEVVLMKVRSLGLELPEEVRSRHIVVVEAHRGSRSGSAYCQISYAERFPTC